MNETIRGTEFRATLQCQMVDGTSYKNRDTTMTSKVFDLAPMEFKRDNSPVKLRQTVLNAVPDEDETEEVGIPDEEYNCRKTVYGK